MIDMPAVTEKKPGTRSGRLKEYFLYFVLYSVFGWLYEVFLEVVVYHWGFTNRGVLFGPYCPVYGFGALLFLFVVFPLVREKELKTRLLLIPVVFVLCALTATALELLTSYLCEFALGSWPWQTYADYKYNFQARIALSPSVRFGLGGVIFLYVLQPLFEKLAGWLGERRLRIVTGVLAAVFAVEVIVLVISRLL